MRPGFDVPDFDPYNLNDPNHPLFVGKQYDSAYHGGGTNFASGGGPIASMIGLAGAMANDAVFHENGLAFDNIFAKKEIFKDEEGNAILDENGNEIEYRVGQNSDLDRVREEYRKREEADFVWVDEPVESSLDIDRINNSSKPADGGYNIPIPDRKSENLELGGAEQPKIESHYSDYRQEQLNKQHELQTQFEAALKTEDEASHNALKNSDAFKTWEDLGHQLETSQNELSAQNTDLAKKQSAYDSYMANEYAEAQNKVEEKKNAYEAARAAYNNDISDSNQDAMWAAKDAYDNAVMRQQEAEGLASLQREELQRQQEKVNNLRQEHEQIHTRWEDVRNDAVTSGDTYFVSALAAREMLNNVKQDIVDYANEQKDINNLRNSYESYRTQYDSAQSYYDEQLKAYNMSSPQDKPAAEEAIHQAKQDLEKARANLITVTEDYAKVATDNEVYREVFQADQQVEFQKDRLADVQLAQTEAEKAHEDALAKRNEAMESVQKYEQMLTQAREENVNNHTDDTRKAFQEAQNEYAKQKQALADAQINLSKSEAELNAVRTTVNIAKEDLKTAENHKTQLDERYKDDAQYAGAMSVMNTMREITEVARNDLSLAQAERDNIQKAYEGFRKPMDEVYNAYKDHEDAVSRTSQAKADILTEQEELRRLNGVLAESKDHAVEAEKAFVAASMALENAKDEHGNVPEEIQTAYNNTKQENEIAADAVKRVQENINVHTDELNKHQSALKTAQEDEVFTKKALETAEGKASLEDARLLHAAEKQEFYAQRYEEVSKEAKEAVLAFSAAYKLDAVGEHNVEVKDPKTGEVVRTENFVSSFEDECDKLSKNINKEISSLTAEANLAFANGDYEKVKKVEADLQVHKDALEKVEQTLHKVNEAKDLAEKAAGERSQVQASYVKQFGAEKTNELLTNHQQKNEEFQQKLAKVEIAAAAAVTQIETAEKIQNNVEENTRQTIREQNEKALNIVDERKAVVDEAKKNVEDLKKEIKELPALGENAAKNRTELGKKLQAAEERLNAANASLVAAEAQLKTASHESLSKKEEVVRAAEQTVANARKELEEAKVSLKDRDRKDEQIKAAQAKLTKALVALEVAKTDLEKSKAEIEAGKVRAEMEKEEAGKVVTIEVTNRKDADMMLKALKEAHAKGEIGKFAYGKNLHINARGEMVYEFRIMKKDLTKPDKNSLSKFEELMENAGLKGKYRLGGVERPIAKTKAEDYGKFMRSAFFSQMTELDLLYKKIGKVAEITTKMAKLAEPGGMAFALNHAFLPGGVLSMRGLAGRFTSQMLKEAGGEDIQALQSAVKTSRDVASAGKQFAKKLEMKRKNASALRSSRAPRLRTNKVTLRSSKTELKKAAKKAKKEVKKKAKNAAAELYAKRQTEMLLGNRLGKTAQSLLTRITNSRLFGMVKAISTAITNFVAHTLLPLAAAIFVAIYKIMCGFMCIIVILLTVSNLLNYDYSPDQTVNYVIYTELHDMENEWKTRITDRDSLFKGVRDWDFRFGYNYLPWEDYASQKPHMVFYDKTKGFEGGFMSVNWTDNQVYANPFNFVPVYPEQVLTPISEWGNVGAATMYSFREYGDYGISPTSTNNIYSLVGQQFPDGSTITTEDVDKMPVYWSHKVESGLYAGEMMYDPYMTVKDLSTALAAYGGDYSNAKPGQIGYPYANGTEDNSYWIASPDTLRWGNGDLFFEGMFGDLGVALEYLPNVSEGAYYGNSGHTSNIKDIICMADVMFQFDVQEDAAIEEDMGLEAIPDGDDSEGETGLVMFALQKLWDTGADLVKLIHNWICVDEKWPLNTDLAKWKRYKSYAETLFMLSHQEMLDIDVVMFDCTKEPGDTGYLMSDNEELGKADATDVQYMETVLGAALHNGCPGQFRGGCHEDYLLAVLYSKNFENLSIERHSPWVWGDGTPDTAFDYIHLQWSRLRNGDNAIDPLAFNPYPSTLVTTDQTETEPRWASAMIKSNLWAGLGMVGYDKVLDGDGKPTGKVDATQPLMGVVGKLARQKDLTSSFDYVTMAGGDGSSYCLPQALMNQIVPVSSRRDVGIGKLLGGTFDVLTMSDMATIKENTGLEDSHGKMSYCWDETVPSVAYEININGADVKNSMAITTTWAQQCELTVGAPDGAKMQDGTITPDPDGDVLPMILETHPDAWLNDGDIIWEAGCPEPGRENFNKIDYWDYYIGDDSNRIVCGGYRWVPYDVIAGTGNGGGAYDLSWRCDHKYIVDCAAECGGGDCEASPVGCIGKIYDNGEDTGKYSECNCGPADCNHDHNTEGASTMPIQVWVKEWKFYMWGTAYGFIGNDMLDNSAGVDGADGSSVIGQYARTDDAGNGVLNENWQHFESESNTKSTVIFNENGNPKTFRWYRAAHSPYSEKPDPLKAPIGTCHGHLCYYCGGHTMVNVKGIIFSFTDDEILYGLGRSGGDGAVQNGDREIVPVYDEDIVGNLKVAREKRYGLASGGLSYDFANGWADNIGTDNSLFCRPYYKNTGLKGMNIQVTTTGIWDDSEKVPLVNKEVQDKLSSVRVNANKLNIAFSNTTKDQSYYVNRMLFYAQDIFDIDACIDYPYGMFPMDSKTADGYEGWTKSNMQLALIKYGMSWEDTYFFDIPVNMSSPMLSDAQIDEIMTAVGINASANANQKKAVELALQAVGNGQYSQEHHGHAYLSRDCTLYDTIGGSLLDQVMQTANATDGSSKPATGSHSCTCTDASGFASYIAGVGKSTCAVWSTDDFKANAHAYSSWKNDLRPGDILVYYPTFAEGTTEYYAADNSHHVLVYIGKPTEDVVISWYDNPTDMQMKFLAVVDGVITNSNIGIKFNIESESGDIKFTPNTFLIFKKDQPIFVDCTRLDQMGNIYLRGGIAGFTNVNSAPAPDAIDHEFQGMPIKINETEYFYHNDQELIDNVMFNHNMYYYRPAY